MTRSRAPYSHSACGNTTMANSSSAIHGSTMQERAPRRRGEREYDEQHEQDHADIARQQQQAEIDRQQEPVAARALAGGAPVVQQRQRPERRGQDRRAEIHARHREGGDAGHQQHRQHGVAHADDRAAEREHRPVGRDDAGLRQHIDAEQAGDAECGLAEPERERRALVAAEQEFVPDGEQQRHFARRRAVEQRRQHASTARLASAPRSRTRTAAVRAGIR